MTLAGGIWRAHLISARKSFSESGVTRVTTLIAVFSHIAGAYWGATFLVEHIPLWQAESAAGMERELWRLVILFWGILALLTALGARQHAFGRDEALLLATLPIPPASRFRALAGVLFIEELWPWTFSAAGALGGALLAGAGGWVALEWLLLLLSGSALACWAAILALSWLLYLLQSSAGRAPWLATLLGLGAASAILQWLIQAPPPEPLAAAIMMAGTGALVYGPAASWSGSWYEQSFRTLQNQDKGRAMRLLRGFGSLAGRLARRRTLTGALAVRGLLRQSRNPLMWARAVPVLVMLAAQHWIRDAIAPTIPSDAQFVVAFAALLVLLVAIDTSPSPFGGEGNRLTLFLTAPVSRAALLRSKFIVHLVPMSLLSLALALVAGARQGLAVHDMATSLASVALITCGIVAIFVWGSAWDIDLSTEIEGAMQTLLNEEAPISRRRVILIGAACQLVALDLLLISALPVTQALGALLVGQALLLTAMWKVGSYHLARATA